MRIRKQYLIVTKALLCQLSLIRHQVGTVSTQICRL